MFVVGYILFLFTATIAAGATDAAFAVADPIAAVFADVAAAGGTCVLSVAIPLVVAIDIAPACSADAQQY